jgi:hypothetical protein
MKSKQRNLQGAQDVTLWRIDTRDGHSFCIPGDLHITRKKTALIWCHDGGGRRHLMFGAQRKMIQSIEAIEADA